MVKLTLAILIDLRLLLYYKMNSSYCSFRNSVGRTCQQISKLYSAILLKTNSFPHFLFFFLHVLLLFFKDLDNFQKWESRCQQASVGVSVAVICNPQKQSFTDILKILQVFLKISQISQEKHCLQRMCFPVKFANFSRPPFFPQHLR